MKEEQSMRRGERLVTDGAVVEGILRQAKILRLAIPDPHAAAPYLVPLNYGYQWLSQQEGPAQLRLVFHGACAGRKHGLLASRPRVGFELDCAHALLSGKEACQYSFAYQSIIGTGRVRPLTGLSEKRQAMDLLMVCQTGKRPPINEAVLARTALYELLADDYSAKMHSPEG